MTKVIYNGKEIELFSELEPGYMELDLLTNLDNTNSDLENTIEMKVPNLKDTTEIDLNKLKETIETKTGVTNE